MHVRTLSVRRPGLPVLSCGDFVEAIQDPRHYLKVKRPESEIFEVNIDVSSDFLTTCSVLVQLGSWEAKHCFVKTCKHQQKRGHSNAFRMEEKKTNKMMQIKF